MRKTIGILAHVDAGKTTLSEAVLYHGKAIRAKGRVDHRDSFLDADAVEKQRGITVFSGQAAFSLGENQYYLVDTPGHADFAGEMERTLGGAGLCRFGGERHRWNSVKKVKIKK